MKWPWCGEAGIPALTGAGNMAGYPGALSLEQLVLDHEVATAIARLLEGVEVNDEASA